MAFANPPQFLVQPCCPENGSSAVVNIDAGIPYDGVFKYNGAADISIAGTDVTMVVGACYTISATTTVGAVTQILTADLSGYLAGSRCEDPTVTVDCPDCNPTPGNYYIKAIPCCGGDPIFFKGQGYTGIGAIKVPSLGALKPGGMAQLNPAPAFSILDYDGVYVFDGFLTQQPGSQAQGLEVGACYTFSFNSVSDATSEITLAEWNALGFPPFVSQMTFVDPIDCDTINPKTGRKYCPDCEDICYRLTDCDGLVINTLQDLSVYVGTYISLTGYTGTFFVEINDAICQDPVGAIKISGTGLAPCPCVCYEVLGKTSISYIDCDGNNQTTYAPDKFCAQAPPTMKGIKDVDYTLIVGTDCVDDLCVDKCFLLTNCDPTAYPNQDATITSTLQSLSQYLNTNSVVELSGYDGCWTVTEAVECDCPVDVTVIRDHRDCEECLGITAYKLSNCEKINEVVYTLQDFSEFVGKVIKDDCACWIVEEINYQPPSETTITTPIVFEDCNHCLTTYYKLTDCDDPTSIIITSTNVSAYVGQSVKIKGCKPCYLVENYTEVPTNWEEVTVTEDFVSCFECKQLVPRCSTVFNNSTEDRTFTYINANGDSEETETVKSGCFSLRTCVQYWDEPDTFIYNYYGDCSVFEYNDGITPGECNCIDVTITAVAGTVETYLALHTGQFYNSKKVYDLTVDGVAYYMWSDGVSGAWYITDALGLSTLSGEIGQLKSGFPDCPIAPSGSWTPGRLPPGTAADEVASIVTTEGTCPPGTTVKVGHCGQYFPNNRKVKPGYNTPICSASKYDKITCNFADILYKKALELRYGISNCCPEEDEKWLIKKELIELQALTDPDYPCDHLPDCSCNS